MDKMLRRSSCGVLGLVVSWGASLGASGVASLGWAGAATAQSQAPSTQAEAPSALRQHNDSVAAIDVDDNAYPLLLSVQALDADDPLTQQTADVLGLIIDDMQGPVLRSFDDFAQEAYLDASFRRDLMQRLTSEPWQAKAYPEVAAYLEAQHDALAVLHDAAQREHFAAPRGTWDDSAFLHRSITALMPVHMDLAQPLLLHANMSLSQNNTADAWRDVLTLLHLARLQSQSPYSFVMPLIAEMDDATFATVKVLLTDEHLGAAQLQYMLDDLGALLEQTEAHQNIKPEAAGGETVGDEAWVGDFMTAVEAGDFDDVFEPEIARQAFAASGNQTSRSAAIDAWFEVRLRAYDAQDLPALQAVMRQVAQTDEQHLEEQQADDAAWQLVTQLAGESGIDPVQAQRVRLMLLTHRRVALLAVAIRLYAEREGEYPWDLEDLVPQYVEALPMDPMSGEAFGFDASDQGFRVYSVGPDGQDDLNTQDDIGIELGRVRQST